MKRFAKRVYFILITCILIPVTFLLLIELVLRLGGYGYPSDFFVKKNIDGKEFFVNNYKFSWRFFPKSMARLSASIKVPVEKDKDAYRIFVVGESAAMGDPDPAFSFSRMLEAIVEVKYPDKKIEIYNTAVTAINSNVIVPIVHDCMKLQPDLLIVYMGNNEVIGPYGLSSALTPFLSSRFSIQAQIWIGGTRIGQWINSIASRKESTPKEWKGMELFIKNNIRHNHPDLEKIYNHFHENLKEICQTAYNDNVKVVLATMITNERDCAPFYSLHRSDLSDAQLKRWEKFFKNGIALESAGKHQQALTEYQQAATIDDTYAELNFRIAKNLQSLSQLQKAQLYFSKARDYDALRFRADSRMNEIIRSVGQEMGSKILLADAAQLANEKSFGGRAGNDLLYEHVHLNPAGNYLLAKVVESNVEKALNFHPKISEVSWEACKQRLAYTKFDQKRIDDLNFSRLQTAPFTNQYTNEKEIALLKAQINSLEQHFDSVFISQAKNDYRKISQAHPFDWFVHLNYLRFLYHFDYYQEAAKEAEALHALLPFEYLSSINMSTTRRALKKYDVAERYLQQAIGINPYFTEAYKNVASLYEEQARFYMVSAYLQKSNASVDELASFYNRAGIYFVKNDKVDSAAAYFKKALQTLPNFMEAQNNLHNASNSRQHNASIPTSPLFSKVYNQANVFFREGKYQQAIEQYQKALHLTPSFAPALNNMGICFVQLNRLEEARIHFSEAIKKDRSFYDAYPNLAILLSQQGEYAQAINVLDKALTLKQEPELS